MTKDPFIFPSSYTHTPLDQGSQAEVQPRVSDSAWEEGEGHFRPQTHRANVSSGRCAWLHHGEPREKAAVLATAPISRHAAAAVCSARSWQLALAVMLVYMVEGGWGSGDIMARSVGSSNLLTGWGKARGTIIHRASLRLRGGEGDKGVDERTAQTCKRTHTPKHIDFTRSPSPLPADDSSANPLPGVVSKAGGELQPTRSESPYEPTRSESPVESASHGGLLIALCAWESLHTIAVGGVAPHVTELAAGLARRGNEVHLFVRAGYDMTLPSYQCINDVHVHRVPIELNPDFVQECNNMCNAFVWFMRETEEYMRCHFDIVHGHDWLTCKAIVQMNQAGRRTVFTCHSTEYGRAGLHSQVSLDTLSQRVCMIEAEACEFAHRVITVSKKLCDEVRQQYFARSDQVGAGKSKLRVIYNGIHTASFDEPVDTLQVKAHYNIAPDARIILSVGRLIPQKGPDILIAALPKLLETNRNVLAVFVGDGHLREYLEKQAESLGVSHAVRFFGTLWGKPLKDIFKASEVVCVPSRYEPFGMAVLEAWACSKPVVVTDKGGPGEFVMHGRDGLKVKDEASNIAWGLREVLCNSKHAANLAKHGRERCAEFSWDIICQRTEEVYRELVEHGARNR